VNNCSVIFDRDKDFGSVDVVDGYSESSESPSSSKIDPDKVAHLTDIQKRQLFAVLDEFPEVFLTSVDFFPSVT
jgi:hypothetical protein